MTKVDLHIHSTASDGHLSPAEVICKAAEAGLTVIALTDHDTTNGIAEALEAANSFPQLKMIPGIEISTDIDHGEMHLLAYFIDYTSPDLLASLSRMRDSRKGRAQRMIDNLAKLGLPVEWLRVQEIAGDGSVGRPHIAQALLEKGYITTFKEAFDKYIAYGGPAYAEREKMTPDESIKLVLGAGGIPVLAHPLTLKNATELVVGFKERGLVGLEAYYTGYTAEEIDNLVALATKHGLITTGGSDYHGFGDGNEMMGAVDVPMKSAEQLIALAERGQ